MFHVNSTIIGEIRALHQEPFGSAPHLHTWKVEVEYPAKFDQVPVDARQRQASLDRAIGFLGDDLSISLGERATNEGIACWLLSRLHLDGAVKVHVRRHGEERSGAVAWI